MEITKSVSITPSLEVLQKAALNEIPGRFELLLGYAGWGPGQLESEILANVWLLAPFDKKILFDVPDKRKLATAANSIGVDLNLLPRNIGHG